MTAAILPGIVPPMYVGHTAVQLAGTPAAEYLSNPERWEFFDVANVTLRYRINSSGTFVPIGGGVTILIDSNRVVTPANQSLYNGTVWEFTGAFSVTLSAGLANDFGAGCIPPASGNASIVSDGTVLLNGATTTVTKTAAASALFGITQRASNRNSYVL